VLKIKNWGDIRGGSKKFRPPYLKNRSSHQKFYFKIRKNSWKRVDVKIYRKIDSEVCQKCKWTRSKIFTKKFTSSTPWWLQDEDG